MSDVYELYKKGASNKEEAMFLAEELMKPDMTKEEAQVRYLHWASTYNEDVKLCDYHGATLVTDELVRLLGNSKDSSILDCACGAGLIAIELKQAGFTHIDGLDANEAMLEEAKKTGAYQKLMHAEIGPQPLDIPNDMYDVVLMVASMFRAHVSPDCLREFTRITKPKGLIVISESEPSESDVPEMAQLEALGQQLEKDGECRLLEKITKQDFYDGSPGYIWIYSPFA